MTPYSQPINSQQEIRMKTISLTIDVETDWGGRLSCKNGNCEGIEKGIPIILKQLESNNIKATFFISALIIPKYKQVVKDIFSQGHEIASHSLEHNIDHSQLTDVELTKQLVKSKNILESTIGEKIWGFRTPQCRVNSLLFKTLLKTGYNYDSSMVRSFFPGRYQNVHIPKEPFDKDGIFEFPITTLPLIRVPFGLLWINAMSVEVLKFYYSTFENKFPNNIVFYLHPFDLLANKKQRDFGYLISLWYNIKSNKVEETLEKLIECFTIRRKVITLKEGIK